MSAEGPGKTSPKLQNDFLLFDPIHCSPSSNYLADFTPPVGEGRQLAPDIGSCKHEYTTKRSQSVLPPLDLRPDGGDEYKLAMVCKKCRIHADVHIAFPSATNPCPNSDYELHHFRRVPSDDARAAERIVYGWECSAPECRARLRISFRLPRLQPAERDLLTNTELLKQRYEAVMKDDPTREGVRQATPMDALNRLRRYVKDSLAAEHSKRAFSANNKRFMEAYGISGRDCYMLLRKLGFTYVEAQGEDIAQWRLPDAPQIEDRLRTDGSSQRELLEDFEFELRALMYKQVSENPGIVNPAADESWSTAEKDMERVLACQGYLRYSSLRRSQVSNEVLPYYASLGAVADFADRLIEFCFNRQCLCDPERRPYYFECLQVITESRPSSESLQLKVATMSSQELISRRDLTAAYRHLDISPSEADDDRIVNLFHSRQSDLGKQAQEDARAALYKIGVARGSQRLINASRQTLETYDDALAWLGNGVNKSTPDEGLIAVVTIKSDNPENEEMAKKAISVIARARSSEYLDDWLLRDSVTEYTMGIDEALRLIGVEDRWESIDKSVIPFMFDQARADRPGDQVEKAIKTLEQAMAGSIPTSQHRPSTWPVGLTSHGNTCYLNSLLQYYFSIKPLREIVLNYDQHKLDTNKRAQKEERVGQRILSAAEISGGQKFAEDLKQLFESMIKASGEHVKPSDDLVCRTFLDIQDYKLLSAKEAPTVSGPNGQSDNNAVVDSADDAAILDPPDQSEASSTTLQASANGDDSDVKMKDGEAILTPPASPKPQVPDAPPLPPRPVPRRFSTTREVALEKAEQKARAQQDVTEAHDLVMFRLRAGMTPQGKDEMGEQTDGLANLFKITLSSTPVKDGVHGKSQRELDSSITSLVPNETTDVYSLLDGVFDLQPSGTAGVDVFKSLSELPPLFQINIPRINWDAETGNTSKSGACVKLPDELYLDRYCDFANDQVLPKRKACWGWRKQLHALKKEQQSISKTSVELDGPTTVAESAKYLKNLDQSNAELEALGMEPVHVDQSLPNVLAEDATVQTQRLVALENQVAELEARLRGNFDDMKNIKYRLAAVFIHRGNTGHGHYWVYIRDFENNVWRNYNDERVEEFTKLNEIYEANDWNHGTPTYAVYVQDNDKTKIISPVCRAPEEQPAPEPNDWRPDEATQNGTDSLPSLESVDPKVTVRTPGQIGVGVSTVQESNGSWDQGRQVIGGNSW